MIDQIISAINGYVLVAVGAGLAIGLAGLGSVLGTGRASGQSSVSTKEDSSFFGIGLVFSVLPQTPAIFGLVVSFMLLFAFAEPNMSFSNGLVAVGAGLAVGLAGLGSGVGNGTASAAAAGGTKEDRSFFGSGLVFSVLPQTQAIFGLVVSFMLLFTFTGESLSLGKGLMAVGAGLAVGLAGLGSGVGNGTASAAAAGATKEDSNMFGYGLAISVLPQTQAVYGLVISFMLMFVI